MFQDKRFESAVDFTPFPPAAPDGPITQTLVKARALIANPENWTKYWFFRDRDGNKLLSADEDGCFSYCARGAVVKAAGCTTLTQYTAAVEAYLAQAIDMPLYVNASSPGEMASVALYNNGHTHEEVLAMFDRGIILARAEGA
jgi:hypothetical protein